MHDSEAIKEKNLAAPHPRSRTLRPRDYLRTPGGQPAQMVLYRPDGNEMSQEDWENPSTNSLAVALDGRFIEDAEGETTFDRYLLLLNAHRESVEFTIPSHRENHWFVVLTSGEPDDTPIIPGHGTPSACMKAAPCPRDTPDGHQSGASSA